MSNTGQKAHEQIKAHKKTAKDQAVKGAATVGSEKDAWRFALVWLVMVVGLCWLVMRAFYLQVSNAEFYIAKGEEFTTGQRAIPVARGMIYDRFGTPLASNAPLVTVVFSPYSYAQAYYLAKKNVLTSKADTKKRQKAEEALAKFDLKALAEASGYPLEKLQEAVNIDENVDIRDEKAVQNALPKGTGSKRLVLLNQVTPEEASAVRALKFKAISEETYDKRFYLQAETMAQVLGYMAKTGNDDVYKGLSLIHI